MKTEKKSSWNLKTSSLNFKNKSLEDKIEIILTHILSSSKYKDINKRQHRLRVFEDQFQEIQ